MRAFFRRFVAATFVSIVVISCAPSWTSPKTESSLSPPTHATVCIALPKERRDEARQAIEEWDRALGSWRMFEPVFTSDDADDACAYWVHEVKEDRVPTSYEDARAWTSEIGGREISMRKGYYEIDTKGILMHEFGHALGAQHADGTLMNPVWYEGAFVCPDRTTVAQVAAWNRVNLSTLSWCNL